MAKKNIVKLIKLSQAEALFNKIKEQDRGDNEIFTSELERVIKKLGKKIIKIVNQEFGSKNNTSTSDPNVSKNN